MQFEVECSGAGCKQGEISPWSRAPEILKLEEQSILEVKATSELGNSLCVPITGGVPRLKHYDSLRSQIATKLSGWKAKTLSLAGRICLINYSLLPISYSLAGSAGPSHLAQDPATSLSVESLIPLLAFNLGLRRRESERYRLMLKNPRMSCG